MRKKFFTIRVVKHEQLERDCGSVSGNIQSQTGWGSERPDLVEAVPVHFRG